MPSLFTGVKSTWLRALQRKPLRHVADKQPTNNRHAVTGTHGDSPSFTVSCGESRPASRQNQFVLSGKDFAQVNETSIQNVDPRNIFPAVVLAEAEKSAVQREHLYRLRVRLDNPVFPNPCPLV